MTNVDQTATAPKKLSPVQELAAEFAKDGELVFRDGDPKMSLFGQFLGTLREGVDYLNWTEKSPETFKGAILARTKDKSQVRLVAFPNKDIALNDPIVQSYLYDFFVKRILRSARKTDSTESQFVTPSGALSVVSSLIAFRFQARAWVDYLKKLGAGTDGKGKGFKNLDASTLKLALKNASFAKAVFPTFKDWEQLLKFMAANAEKKGYNPSLLISWAATRDQAQDVSASISLSNDLETMLSAVNQIIADDAADDDEDEIETETAA